LSGIGVSPQPEQVRDSVGNDTFEKSTSNTKIGMVSGRFDKDQCPLPTDWHLSGIQNEQPGEASAHQELPELDFVRRAPRPSPSLYDADLVS
jgi:hypothetical protein